MWGPVSHGLWCPGMCSCLLLHRGPYTASTQPCNGQPLSHPFIYMYVDSFSTYTQRRFAERELSQHLTWLGVTWNILQNALPWLFFSQQCNDDIIPPCPLNICHCWDFQFFFSAHTAHHTSGNQVTISVICFFSQCFLRMEWYSCFAFQSSQMPITECTLAKNMLNKK